MSRQIIFSMRLDALVQSKLAGLGFAQDCRLYAAYWPETADLWARRADELHRHHRGSAGRRSRICSTGFSRGCVGPVVTITSLISFHLRVLTWS